MRQHASPVSSQRQRSKRFKCRKRRKLHLHLAVITVATTPKLLARDALLLGREAVARVPDVKRQSSDRYRDSVQTDEQVLVSENGVVGPASGELGDSVCAPDEYTKVGNPQRCKEQLESARLSELSCKRIEAVAVAVDGQAVVRCENAEDDEGEDLRGQVSVCA